MHFDSYTIKTIENVGRFEIGKGLYLILIIFVVLATLACLFVVIYYTAYTSAPSELHKNFTTGNSSNNNNESEEDINIRILDTYDYNNEQSYELWKLLRFSSYVHTKERLGNCTGNECYKSLTPKKKTPAGKEVINLNAPEGKPKETILTKKADDILVIPIEGVSRNNNKITKKIGIVYHKPSIRTTVIVMNGTSDPADWRTDMTLKLSTNDLRHEPDVVNKGKIHLGFKENYMGIRDQIKKIISQFNSVTDEKNWYLVGHSLGGAIVTLIAYDQYDTFNYQPHVYTYGQPKVGDNDFVEKINELYKFGAYRISNDADIITMLPPPIWFNNQTYKHAFSEKKFSLNLGKYTQNHIIAYRDYLKEQSKNH